ncbi:hypothetical protein GCM10010371_67360 [Streptomyces subrutilus]|uniref:Uncharacterized protein n=1 Tax=Streptomyces subrutilus TaxID=36818 RepID=A0A5P2UXS5_9ACTN|nr:hypothetical protein [Streptomyces subrutilus]QEU82284.1 hypothetical protein CP968_32020 [Streptomyces subrutilus]GGZ98152.1 hypothetical protein GCM10010371_67360 [Streptomyces subrutilus]
MSWTEADVHELLLLLGAAARWTDHVTVSRDGTEPPCLPHLVWHEADVLFGALEPASVQAWLTGADLNATAESCKSGVKVTLGDIAAGEYIARCLSARADSARACVTRLGKALRPRRVRAQLSGSPAGKVTVTIWELAGSPEAANLAAALGADGLVEGLNLYLTDGQDIFEDRMRWLLTGVVGAGVYVEVKQGCDHDPSRLTIELTEDQADALTARLT